jgi:hypothetical protein
MFIPVDWRSGLKLDNGIVDSITIQNIPKLRNKLNLGVYIYIKLNPLFLPIYIILI